VADIGQALLDAIADLQSTMERRFTVVDERMAALDGRMATLDGRMAMVDGRMATLDERTVGLDERTVRLDERTARLDERTATLASTVASMRAHLEGLPIISRAVTVVQQDVRALRAAFNDFALTNATAGEIEALHHDVNRVQAENAELAVKVATLERLVRELQER
jgi:chromosome segregation ATPase